MEPHGRDHGSSKTSNVAHRASRRTRGSGGTPTSLRWSPTKEQVEILESLYRQGIRTPKADQIQQITAQLRAFGHIEGKNVFYWFQNHKARQRQKQKQEETIAYIKQRSVELNRFLHEQSFTVTACPLFASPPGTSHLQYPCPNIPVVRGPYYVPVQGQGNNSVGSFPQQHIQNELPKKPSPSTSASRRSLRLSVLKEKRRILPAATAAGASHNHGPRKRSTVDKGQRNAGTNYNKETLALFPLSPTGGSKSKEHDDRRFQNYDDQDYRVSGIISFSSSKCQASSTSSGCKDGYYGDKTFYDFL